MELHLSVSIREPSLVGTLRRVASNLVSEAGFGEEKTAQVALVATKLGTNLVKHTTNGGEVLVRLLSEAGCVGVELISLDAGPGMKAPKRMLADGVSTIGTSGYGLGTVRRLSDEFNIHSRPDTGTAILSRIWFCDKPAPRHLVSIGGVMVAKPKEHVCADAWDFVQHGNRSVLLVAGGLGHGENAAASRLAVSVFRESSILPPSEILQRIHQALQGTRGAAVAIAMIDQHERTVNIPIGYFGNSLPRFCLW